MQNYTEQYSALWDRCSTQLPDFPKSFNDEEKLQKELVLDQFLKMIKTFRKERSKKKLIAGFDQRLFLEKTREFLHDGLDFTESQLEMMFSDELIAVSKSFVRRAVAFDPELSFHDIFQACRNVWIMNGLQLVMGIPMQLTDSIFAYSMLYPYSDNIIDDPNIPGFEKMVFSERFRDRLSGIKLEASTKTESAIFRLVELIEKQYSRVEFPEVFESLLGIHEAQTRKARQRLLQCVAVEKTCQVKCQYLTNKCHDGKCVILKPANTPTSVRQINGLINFVAIDSSDLFTRQESFDLNLCELFTGKGADL